MKNSNILEIRWNIVSSFITKLISAFIGIPTFYVVSKHLPESEAGNFFLILSITPIFLLIETSLGGKLINDLSSYKHESQAEKLKKIVGAIKLCLKISFFLIFLLCLILIAYKLFFSSVDVLYECIIYSFILFSCLSFLQLFDRVQIVNGKIYRVQIADLSTSIIYLLVVYYLIMLKADFIIIIITYPILYFLVKIINYSFDYNLRNLIQKIIYSKIILYKSNEKLDKDNLYFLLITLFSMLGTSFDLVYLKQFAENNEAIIIEMAFFQRIYLIFNLLASIAIPFWPIFSKLIASHDFKRAIRISNYLILFYILSGLIVTLLILLLTPVFNSILLSGVIILSYQSILIGVLPRYLCLIGEGISPIMNVPLLVKYSFQIQFLLSLLSIILKPLVIKYYSLPGLFIVNGFIYGVLYFFLCSLSSRKILFNK
ncbi:hypothetical protein ICN10_06270 [Polynucleobacter sp. 86C-FISCH]|uniref:hypothetical protein n=1 Tax=Polynucleobacter sp. 86C-FISCH TaxID=2689101 RepID=UPI001C0DC976|nr:hypothetical protein [Polynucleobacter sp. 86C-FISCH]MBU3596005.1 hypothetical protein [Polynucleobacter sp. 86C-FISCH]